MINYTSVVDVATAGQIADTGNRHVESFAASAAIPFGVVVTNTGNLVASGGALGIGITVSTHVNPNGYQAKDNVGVMVAGNVWAKIKGTESPVLNSRASYDAVTGEISTTGASLRHSVIVGVATLKDGTKIANVQLNYPRTN